LNHRALVLDVRRSAGAVLDSATLVRTVDELDACIARSAGPWVAKAPHSAAGRLRVRSAVGALDAPTRSRSERLFDLFGCLLFEPWRNRLFDYGILGVNGTVAGCSPLWRAHRILVDRAGRFSGITTHAVGISVPLSPTLDAIVASVKGAVVAASYEGPFGLDVYMTVDIDETDGFRPRHEMHLSEINARMTFGHVARRLFDRAGAALSAEWAKSLTLRFGRGAPAPGTIPLLLPGPDDDTSAWLEVPPRHASCE
jgi:hypothetical protein